MAALLALLAGVGTAGTGLVTWKWREASALAVAEGRQRQEAEESERLALRNLYEARLASITQAWAERDFARLGLLVDEAAPSPGKPDFRGWEWYFFLAQARTSRTALAGSGPYAGRLAWCEERKLLAAATAEGAIDVWDRQEQRLLRTLPAQGGKVLRLAWRPDGRQLASAGEDTRLRIWDVDSAQVLRALPGRALATEPPALAWSPDGRLLACAGEGPTVQLWDTERWEPARPLEINQPTAIMLDLAWHPDSTRLAGALRYGTLALWDVRQGRLLAARNVGTGGYAFSVAWNPDGSKLAVGAFADMFPRPAVSLWDGSARFLGHLMPGMEQVACVRWSPDGRTLAASGSDNTVTFLDTQVMAPVLKARFAAFGGPVEFAWDSGADRLLIGADHLYVVDPQSLRARGVVLGSPRARLITSVRHSPDGRWLAASICGDNRGSPDVPDPVAVWDARTGKIARRLSHPPGHFYAVRWSPDSRRLVGVDYRGNFPVWDAATGQMVWKGAAGEDFSADRLAWSPDGRWLACLGQRRVVFWDAARGEKTRELAWAAPRIGRYLGWSPDGRLFSAAGLVWETDGWEQQEPLSGPDDPPYSLCWSPDGRAIAATNEQGWIQFMEMASRREAGAQPAHNGRAVVAWSPDGRRVASGGPEGTVRIWDPATHKSLVTLSLDKIPVTALDWSPDGRSLVCGCGEGNVRVLRADDSMPAAPPF